MHREAHTKALLVCLAPVLAVLTLIIFVPHSYSMEEQAEEVLSAQRPATTTCQILCEFIFRYSNSGQFLMHVFSVLA